MAQQNPQVRNAHSDDELDDILNGLTDGRDATSIPNDQTQPERPSNRESDLSGAGLGIDEEITITKKRIPIPKLNEERLASDPGIPRLRKISKERLRFKGKGHEYGDIARMLNMYQLWLDDLYPRAKFADALAIIEKVGHTKRMQMMRKEWIDEGKPRRTTERDEEHIDELPTNDDPAQPGTDDMQGIESNMDAKSSETIPGRQDQTEGQLGDVTAGDDPDEDELDALLAESTQPDTAVSRALPSRTAASKDDPFADEMEAMADMEDMW
ncbi:Swi3-domain-containing protein [Dothidotthia symphoricarpi CBS 119687]|uniref:Chromosome segregation in meiosis protein n=1 Tax=Dothidotthia symphoricarpi CBS 119687 TaxID=1392245 RepID=A0A6A6ANR1_9PLEO|nr:Swi3-domain-containing protein [Dothidotthia symphoricarpi CBS 119687]KAF2133430.1 Swi3-domain-containing protein [Dothidotthia symphoricarpi CBS 119687]